MLRVVIAPDSFKGSLSAKEVALAAREGLLKAGFEQCDIVPMADGGEGTVEAFLTAIPGQEISCRAHDALGRPIDSFYGIVDGDRAVIEMAAASGLPLLQDNERNPLLSSTYGTGELLLDAARKGCKRFIVGIGGSATNDGGAGMAQALGARFLDAQGKELPPGGAALARLARIDMSGFTHLLDGCEILVACDVDNPLCGPQGASAIFGPQKGATADMIRMLDAALEHYAQILKRDVGMDILQTPGSGAAGGLGGAFLAFLGAQLRRGIDIVIEAANLEEKISQADLVITGEGRTDHQTLFGKVPMGIAGIAQKYGKPVICLCGGLGSGFEALYEKGLTAALSISDGPMTLQRAMDRSAELMQASAYSVGKIFIAAR